MVGMGLTHLCTLLSRRESQEAVETKAHQWQFRYEQPRAGMIEAGAQAGDLLVDIWIEGGRITGTAYIFAGRCGAHSYRIDGDYDKEGRLDLKGKAPKVARSTCQVVGLVDDNLIFESFQQPNEIAEIESYASRFDRYARRNPSTSRYFADVSNYETNERAQWHEFKTRKALDKVWQNGGTYTSAIDTMLRSISAAPMMTGVRGRD
jgi:hypothetical protein